MAIAPLAPDVSPTAGGAITSAAARLFAQEGHRLAEEIEQMSLKNEAQAKAPALAAAYGKGLMALAQGDMTGMEMLTRAEAESVGNPFLMAMTKSATSEGARIATNYLQSQRQQVAQTNILDRQTEMQRAMGDRQAEDDWRSAASAIEKQYAEDLERWKKDEAGRRRQAEIEGVPFTPTQPPEKPAYPQKPTPQSKAFGGTTSSASPDMPTGGGTFDTGIMPGDTPPVGGATPMPGTPATAESVRGLAPEVAGRKDSGAIYTKIAQGENAMTGRLMAGDEIVNEAQAAQGPVQSSIEGPAKAGPLVNENWPAAPQEGIDLLAPRSPEIRGEEVVVPLGRMNWKVSSPSSKKMSVSETVNTSTGSKTYSIKGGDESDDSTKLIDAIAGINAQDYDFAQWVAKNLREKKQITVEPIPGGEKDGPMIAKANGEPFGMENPAAAKDENAPDHVARPVSAEVGKLWVQGEQALRKLGPRVSLEFPPTKEEVNNIYADQIDKINAGSATLAEVNKINKRMGFKPLTEDEVKKGKREAIRTPSPEIEAQLEELGIKNPMKKDAPAPKEGRQIVRELKKKMMELKKDLIKNPSVFNQIVALQEQINEIEKEKEESFKSMVGEGMTGIN